MALLSACASSPGTPEQPPPELSGPYELRVAVRGGGVTEDLRIRLDFLDEEWMTHENLDTGAKAGLVRTWLRQAYTVNECLSWGFDESGDRVCRVHGEVERYRRVRGRGDADGP